MEKHFVFAKLVVKESDKNKALENAGGDEVLTKVGGSNAGLPYFAFLDARGETIVNSRRPLAGKPDGANIGHPFAPEEVDWFMEMLRKGAPKMTAAEREAIEKWLRNQKK